jgi:hypothetical protein
MLADTTVRPSHVDPLSGVIAARRSIFAREKKMDPRVEPAGDRATESFGSERTVDREVTAAGFRKEPIRSSLRCTCAERTHLWRQKLNDTLGVYVAQSDGSALHDRARSAGRPCRRLWPSRSPRAPTCGPVSLATWRDRRSGIRQEPVRIALNSALVQNEPTHGIDDRMMPKMQYLMQFEPPTPQLRPRQAFGRSRSIVRASDRSQSGSRLTLYLRRTNPRMVAAFLKKPKMRYPVLFGPPTPQLRPRRGAAPAWAGEQATVGARSPGIMKRRHPS